MKGWWPVSLRQPCQNVKNSNVPQLKMKKSLPITAFYFMNSINELPVPRTGWGLTAEAAARWKGLGNLWGKAGHKPTVFWQQERLPLHDLLEMVVMEVVVCSCLALARPLLEYCIQIWSPESGRGIVKLEEMEQGAPRLNWAGILAMRERVMELGFFRRGGFVWTCQQHPCTSEQGSEKTDSGTSQKCVTGK